MGEGSALMSETYTKKQIRAIRKKYAYLIRAVEKYGTKQRALAAGNPVTGEGGPDLSEEEIDFALLLSVLSTAEQERDALKSLIKMVRSQRDKYFEFYSGISNEKSELWN